MSEPLSLETLAATAPVPRDPALECLPGAAAVLDAELRLVSANASFVGLCRAARAGLSLVELLPPAGSAPALPLDGGSSSYLARDGDGEALSVTLARSGDRVGALARKVVVGDADAPLATALQALADQGRAQDALLTLSREVALAAGEDELLAAIARCVRQMFPGRHFCLRIVDPRTAALTSLYADGRLVAGGRESLAFRRAAAEKAHLALESLPEGHIVLTEEEPLIFEGSARGVATPLAAAGQFFGLINLEYPPGVSADPVRDEKLLIQLANQAAIGIRNAKLIEELTFVRKYLEELIENANALILVVDRHGKVTVFNQALVQLTGFTGAEVAGLDLMELVPDSERVKLEKVLQTSLAGQRVDNYEGLLRRRDGSQVRIAVSTSTVRNAMGAVEGVIAIGQDLTRHRELERRIIQAEKLASLGQLAAGVVHELNNPLTTITMYSEALLQAARLQRAEGGDVDKLKRIRESAERMLRFTRDLTSYARPAQESPEVVDVPRVLDQAIRYCEHNLKQTGATLLRSDAEGLPQIRGVRSNLVQVFVNLLINACHAMGKGGGQVRIATRPAKDGVEVEVSDDGVGIEAANLARIFDPFFTTKPEGHGTGLGLSIVHGIVEKHGGTIRATSTPGQGACFTLWLPRDPSANPS